MATLYVTEFPAPFIDIARGMPMVGFGAKLAQNNVTVAAGSAQSAAFNTNTRVVRLHTDVICSVEIGGTNPTATAASSRMAANQTEYYYVNPGDKLAVITNT
jgi:hypothetical protein